MSNYMIKITVPAISTQFAAEAVITAYRGSGIRFLPDASVRTIATWFDGETLAKLADGKEVSAIDLGKELATIRRSATARRAIRAEIIAISELLHWALSKG